MLRPSSRKPLHRLPAFRLALLAVVATAALALPSAALAGPHLYPVPTSFKSTSLGETYLQYGSTNQACTSGSTVSGIWNSGSTGTGTMTLKGCTAPGVPCNTEGQVAGTMVSSSLTFELIYIDAAHKKIGLLMTPKSGAFFEPICGGVKRLWTGSLIASLPNIHPGEVQTSTLLTLGSSPTKVEETGAEHVLTQGIGRVLITGQQNFELSSGARWEP